jgi:hypothetical protein
VRLFLSTRVSKSFTELRHAPQVRDRFHHAPPRRRIDEERSNALSLHSSCRNQLYSI